MPLYEYECELHGAFVQMGSMARCAEPASCPECGSEAPRVISRPTLLTLSPRKRNAAARNEKSRHEPHVCTSGCHHRHKPPSAARQAEARSGRQKLHSYDGPRPWVIEHR